MINYHTFSTQCLTGTALVFRSTLLNL